LPQPGTLIEGKYEILGKIREGGMGAIYKVRHKLLDEVRVVKVMRPEMIGDEELQRRFVEEAKTATRLKHPHICTIHDFALDDDGTAYLVMEFIEGINLADLMVSGHPPNLSLSLEIAHQALLALAYLHRKSIVHRDVAPDNLMLTHDEDGRPHVKLIDLGIAKAVDRDHRMTSTGVFLGKLKYASPELFGSLLPGEKIDGRSDLYSLGVVLYEILTGVRPIPGDAPAELLRAHLFLPPKPFEETDPTGRVPPEVRAVILKALEKKREDRFASAEEFDREIVALRRRYAAPEDLQGTQAIVSSARQTRDSSAATVTPSAQDRLDRHFGPNTTPPPAKSSPPSTPTVTTELGEEKAGAVKIDTSTKPMVRTPAAPRRRAFPAILPALAVLVTLGVTWWVITHRAAQRGERPFPAPSPVATAAVVLPPPAATAEPLPTIPPSAAQPPAAQPTAPPAIERPSVDDGARRSADKARSQTTLSRENARRAHAAELAPAEFERAAAQERKSRSLLDRGSFAAAQAGYELAAQLFDTAQNRAETAQREAHRISTLPTAAPQAPARPEPTRAPPTSAPVEAPRPTPLPAEPARPSDTERIRDLVRRYEKAQSALDADAYARIYPGADAQKIRTAFEQMRSQSVEFEIEKIEVAPGGASATVRGRETRTAVPRMGPDQHFTGPRVLYLDKRGDTWVITRLGS
jgi:serine/threonine protein kinase/ketosteroid isomerase-like protein